ncbi:hypothetical protein MNBD_GAMMA24-2620 [hydrothermal vent metagenome]|uniref:Uncharacterized protein n=1 Tax=hydrothermal vent metagenome TaxID=652676 RepID=A0A3B1BJF1_9ZZZZ
MKRIELGYKSWLTPLLSCMLIITLAGISPAQAEPPVRLSPSDILSSLLGSMVGGLSPSYAPIRVQAECSHELGQCWKANGMNKSNVEQVSDLCWRESKRCPKICKDEYFSRRKLGMDSAASDPLFSGRKGEDTSCVPGVDERTHPGTRVKVNDSAIRIRVTIGGQAVGAEVTAVPVDDQGQEKKRTTSSPNYSKSNAYNDSFGPILLNLPAGKYRLQVLSPDRFYHRVRAFPEQVELVTVEAGQTLDKNYPFGMGQLVVKVQNKDGKPLTATLELRRSTTPDSVLLRTSLPLDRSLLAGKYRLMVRENKGRRSRAFDVEVKDGKSTTKAVVFR